MSGLLLVPKFQRGDEFTPDVNGAESTGGKDYEEVAAETCDGEDDYEGEEEAGLMMQGKFGKVWESE